MQVIILAAIVAVACATPVIQGGSSATYNAQDGLGNYNFGYNEGHATGGTFRRESGSKDVKIGSYGLTDADGRRRIVSYVADANGFRATISSNEQGVDASKSPADASLSGSPIVAQPAPAVSYAAVPAGAAFTSAVNAAGIPIAYNSVVQHGPYAYGFRF